jgi:hypothetical protein
MKQRSTGSSIDAIASSAGPRRISIRSAYGEASMPACAQSACSSLSSHVTIRPPSGRTPAIISALVPA